MDEAIKIALNEAQPGDFHQQLFLHVKGLVDMSRHYMIQYYDIWDHNDDVYRGLKRPDKEDVNARNRNEPEKMVVPLTYSQVQTFIAFCTALYTQRERVFELIGTGEEDHRAAKIGEALIDRDLTYNCFPVKLYQFLLDVGRFGIGIIKSAWHRDVYTQERTTTIPAPSIFGIPLGAPRTTTEMAEVVRYLGNKLINVSPYSFFPDVRLPLYRFQEGEFVASEDMYSLSHLRQMEKNGDVSGIQWVKPQKADVFALRRRLIRQTERAPMGPGRMATGSAQTVGAAILTEVQVSLVPSMFKINGEPMGPEDYPVRWNIWYVNDTRIVKAEPLGYKHDLYTYDIGEYSPDMLNLINEGLADSMDRLQDVISWLINSHITNVRKVIGDKLIVDPSGIEMKDLTERRPVIRLRPDAARTGVDKWVKQLQVVDVTANHMKDAQDLQSVVQLTTGINDNALGQYHVGRRSATEARNVNSATAARLKVTALMLFRQTLEPLARKMLSNLQQGLDVETFVRVIGENANPADYAQFTKVTKDDLVGDYDFEVFDGTLPMERAEQAAALQEFLQAMFMNPQIVPVLGYDIRKLVAEWLELRGIRNPKRFEIDQLRMQELAAQMQQWGLLGQKNGQPNKSGNGVGGPPNGGGGLIIPGLTGGAFPTTEGGIAGATPGPGGRPGGQMVSGQT
jgi:hypothetical protein